ncbi:hypothetical protein BDC45DRAFT_259616 [Circinella umbellata]|nr:hypothetical protein BDC45DRAFT_259616 [Circinella umbellata]
MNGFGFPGFPMGGGGGRNGGGMGGGMFNDPFFSNDPFSAHNQFHGLFGGGMSQQQQQQQQQQPSMMSQSSFFGGNQGFGGGMMMDPFFSSSSSSSSFSSSNFGGGGGGVSKSVSQSTQIVNGRAQTVTVTKVQDANGTTVTEDYGNGQKRITVNGVEQQNTIGQGSSNDNQRYISEGGRSSSDRRQRY